MIIDFHTHIFPPDVRRHRERYLDNEPAFELLYSSPKSKMVGADQLVAAMDAHGVDKSVTFGFPWSGMETARRHNDYIIEAVARHPDRLIGFACMDAAHPRAAEEADRCLAAGLSGVGELAFYCSDMDRQCLGDLDGIMAVARQYGRPVMIHTNEPIGHRYAGKTDNTLAQIYAMIRQYPDNDLVLAHWGGGIFWYNLLKKEVTGALQRVWFDTAASPYLYRHDIYPMAMALAGADKILFGTDYPLLPPRRYLEEMAAAGLDEDQMAAICYGNAAKLLGL